MVTDVPAAALVVSLMVDSVWPAPDSVFTVNDFGFVK